MPLQPVHPPQPLLIAPPLLPPLVLRTENGFFGAKRHAIGEFGECPPCNRFEAPPDRPPEEQEGGGRRPPLGYVQHQLHEGVDLEGEAGDCVFAAYSGRVRVTKALELGRPVEIDHRDSVFFGPHRVPASVRLT